MPEVDPKLLGRVPLPAGSDPSCRSLDARLLAMLVYDTSESRADMSRDLAPTSPLLLYRLIEQDETAGTYDSVLFRRLRLGGAAGPAPGRRQQPARSAAVRRGRAARRRGRGAVPRGADQRRAAAALASPEALLVMQGVRGAGKRLLLQVAAARVGRKLLLLQGMRARGDAAGAQVRPLLRSILRGVPAARRGAGHLRSRRRDRGSRSERGDLPAFVTQLAAEHQGAMAVTLGRDRMPRLDFRPLVQFSLEVPVARRARHPVAAHVPRRCREVAERRHPGVAVRGTRRV